MKDKKTQATRDSLITALLVEREMVSKLQWDMQQKDSLIEELKSSLKSIGQICKSYEHTPVTSPAAPGLGEEK